ncbi:alpha-ketoglutarate-dependent dioxygenase [Elsinoe australis]|uniref:mRNA N(6)-methyladenine demethylase n=1 Tax=Elsinoe australis TaxID=40998 RepID=A0A4U7AS63_9PEZI|nr:alpha-ketoglutarate-dependent dioxygenase [Elsinoe australis]
MASSVPVVDLTQDQIMEDQDSASDHEPEKNASEKPDAHAKPPEDLKAVYKRYQKITRKSLDEDESIFDPAYGRYAGFSESPAGHSNLQMPDELMEIVKKFLANHVSVADRIEQIQSSYSCYEHPDLPGLFVFPSLLPEAVQTSLLDRLLHRDVSNPAHDNNLRLHYNVAYDRDDFLNYRSFFDPKHQTTSFLPHDPSTHKFLDLPTMLDKKLRWITLGGQYDWTNKVYPPNRQPPFPADIASLINGIFPAIKPQAAILNLYNPGHTLSLHRDVSEECNRPLVSISLGCEGLFLAGLESETDGPSKFATMRLRSGDVVVMSGAARYAWHAVPKVLPNTCPEWLADWPVIPGDPATEKYSHYKGWMSGKRINLNVRQMYD